MLEVILHSLIPDKVNTFEKLEGGEPYHFDRWTDDMSGLPCLYYRFKSRDGAKQNKKRIPVREIITALRELQRAGVLDRQAFERVCPIAKAGPCGFAVVGRILEKLHAASYTGSNGFSLTDANEASRLLEDKLK
jgi:hypothetical protein